MTQPTQDQTLARKARAERWGAFEAALDANAELGGSLVTALKTSASGLAPEFWRSVLLGVLREQPELIDECDPQSFVAAVRACAQLGLMPDKRSGHAYFLPFNDTKSGRKLVQFIVGYKGLIELALRNKAVEHVVARCVHAGDEFSYALGLEERLHHVPASEQRGGREISHAYAVVRFKDRSPMFVVVDRGEINAIRSRSKARNAGPWVTDFAAMCAKTAVRQVMKWVPLDNPIRRALEAQMQEEEDWDAPRDVTAEVGTHNLGAALAQRMGGRALPATQPLELPAPAPAAVEPEPEPAAEAKATPAPAADAAHDESPIARLFPEPHQPALDPESRRGRR